MKTLKKYLFALVFVVTFATGCNDSFLDKLDPNNSTPESYFTTISALQEAVIASYASQAAINAFNYRAYWLGDFPADDVESRDLTKSWESFTLSPSSGDVFNVWKAFYIVINRANQTLVYSDEIEAKNSTEEALKKKVVAEARYLRSLFHYYLTMWWGAVPYKTEENIFDNSTPVSTRDEILANIVTDLEAAIPDLPSKSEQPQTEKGRATQGAARTLLARVLMVQQNWQKAESTCTDIINGGYSLLTDLRAIHDPTNSFNDESIYEIVFTYTGGGNHDWGGIDASANSANNKSPFRTYWVYRPYREGDGAKATDKLINAYDANDPRKDEYFFGPNTVADGVPYDFAARGWCFKKCVAYNQYTLKDIDQRNSAENFVMFRLADVVLMRAEARAMQNKIGASTDDLASGSALGDLNSIRRRARNGGDASLVPDVTVTSQTDVMNAIKNERFIELCAEVVRLIDIKRWGDYDELGPNFVPGRDELLPLPDNEVLNNVNIKTNNPGW